MKLSNLSDTQKSQQLQSKTKNILDQDHSTTIFFCFQITINILMIIQYGQQLIFTSTICILNVVFIISLFITRKTNRYVQFTNICIFISRISTLLYIPLLNQELKISLIVLLHNYNENCIDSKYFNYFEAVFVRIFALAIVIINYDLIGIISVSFQLLLQLNKLVQVQKQSIQPIVQQNPFAQSLISQKEQDNLWKNRIQTIPVSFFMINQKTLKITFKNQTAISFFSLYSDNDEEFEQLILYKLQFSLVQDNIYQIQQSISNLKIRQRLRSRYNKKFDSDVQQSEPNNLFSSSSGYQQQFSRHFDTVDYNKIRFCLVDLITSIQAGEFREYINNNSLELFCQETLGAKKTVQLAGQILINQQNDDLIVLLNDISKQNELQQLISTDEFKSKIIESFSHELRTPLNGAINFLSALLQDSDTTEFNKSNYIMPAISSLRVQSYLISDIIDFQQQYAKNFELLIREFQMKELIYDITSLFTVQCQMKQLEFDVDLIDCCCSMLCTDQGRLMQILVNLLQNAIKFSTEGLIVLKISSYSKDIIKFTVTDMGQGVADSNISTIQSYLNSLNNQKDIQLNKNWQGFGLLISALLVQKLGPIDRNFIKFESDGLNQGAKVSFFIKNQSNKGFIAKQPTIRQNTNRLQSSANITSSCNNLNGTVIQTTEFVTKIINRKRNTKLISQKSNDNSMFTESVVFDSLDQKFGLLSPVQPSLITDIAYHKKVKIQQTQSRNDNSSQRSNQSRILSIQFIKQTEDQEDEELLQTYKRRKKCICQKIMSVDDEIFNQKSIQLLLSKMGFEVILAFNGQQACQDIVKLSKCGKNCQLLTLILMDYQMPIMNGCQATEKLIEMMNQNLIPKIHIVGLTAFTNTNDIENCIRSGMSDVLHKPLNLKEFKEILTLI